MQLHAAYKVNKKKILQLFIDSTNKTVNTPRTGRGREQQTVNDTSENWSGTSFRRTTKTTDSERSITDTIRRIENH